MRSAGRVGEPLTRAGGLLFFADHAEALEAVDAANGKALWHFNTTQEITPMAYAANAKPYVGIAAGSDVCSFTLP